jgi:hybrid cluster-associated redox disulfide protein
MVKKQTEKITKNMTFGDVLNKFGRPAADIMMKYGLHCIGCHVATYETIEQGARSHGLSDEQIKEMINELNNVVKKEKSTK